MHSIVTKEFCKNFMDVVYLPYYLKNIKKKKKKKKSCYMNNDTIEYGEDTIYFGNNFSVKYPKFGNYLEINKIPIILDLLNFNIDGDTSII